MYHVVLFPVFYEYLNKNLKIKTSVVHFYIRGKLFIRYDKYSGCIIKSENKRCSFLYPWKAVYNTMQ